MIELLAVLAFVIGAWSIMGWIGRKISEKQDTD